MAEAIFPTIEADPTELETIGLEKLADLVVGFDPELDDTLEKWQMESYSLIAAEVAEVASDVPVAIFRYFGNSVVGVPPVEAAAATVTATFVMQDTAGYTVPQGTAVAVPASGDEVHAFETVDEFTVAPGGTTQSAVQLIAVDEGAAASGLGGAGVVVDLLDPLSYVASVTLEAATSGGEDAEEDDAYLDRLASRLQLLSTRPILPRDFEILAREEAGGRWLAIDGYDPDTDTDDNERTIALFGVDEAGADQDATSKAAVQAALDAEREVTFVVKVADPTRTTVNFEYAAVCHEDFDAADVKDRADEALAEYVDPAEWGLPPYGDELVWNDVPVVRYLEVAAVLNNVEGLDYLTSLTINGGTADVALAGRAPLPELGTITGTVTAP